MSSSVFFKFKSQREPSRVAFDGTGISVFELKREIIRINQLGDGTDFDLSIYNEDTNDEYDDDTTIIPRGTSIIARRLPAKNTGQGRAARYVSGKAPVNARNTRTELKTPAVSASSTVLQPQVDMSNMSEEERIAAMFKQQDNQWQQQQVELAHATPVHRGTTYRGKPVNVPDHPPPSGYVCYRCGEKGHWIQACPTNSDPNYDGRPRIKRTTGIPRSFLKAVEKPVLTGDGDEGRHPPGVMVNADGEWVIAEPDKASWEQYQAKTKASAAAALKAAETGSRELRGRGLECDIDKRMFVDPVKTPCCKKTYCNDCITNALIENDLVCPNCSSHGVLLDNLVHDEETMKKIKEYEDEKAAAVSEKEKSRTPEIKNEKVMSPPVTSSDVPKSLSARSSPSTPRSTESRKRSADEMSAATQDIPMTKKVRGPEMQYPAVNMSAFDPSMFNQMIPPNAMALNPMMLYPQGMNGMNYGGMMPMNSMMNPMMPQQNYMNMNSAWNNMGGGGMMYPQNGMYPNMMSNVPYGMNGPNNMMQPQNKGGFSNQQRTIFSEPFPREEENAYFRQPVNPHRHQNRQRRIRPSDYREL